MGKSVCIEALQRRTLLAIDSLDPTFDGDGMALVSFSDLGNLQQAFAQGAAVAPDGRIVAAGFAATNGNSQNWAVLAALDGATGAPDLTFGNAGRVVASTGSTKYPCFNAVAVQPDGRIVAVGQTDFFAATGDVLIARYDLKGAPDPSFGSAGTGQVTLGDAGQADAAKAVCLLPDGRILVGGTIGGDFGLAQFTSSGQPDPSFYTFGQRRTDWYGFSDGLYDLAVQPDGKIVAVGCASASNPHPVLARYTATGEYDATFGASGKLDADALLTDGYIFSVAIAPDGKIVVAGYANDARRMYIARFTASGMPDGSFSGDGVEYIGPTGNVTDMNVVCALDGSVLYSYSALNTGQPYELTVVGRLTSYGAPDPRFANGDVLRLGANGAARETFAYHVELQPDGKALAVGSAYVDAVASNQMAVFRLDAPPPGESATISSGVLSITGTVGDDSVVITNAPGGLIQVTINDRFSKSFASSSVASITTDLLAGDDLVTLGQDLPCPTSCFGGAGRDMCVISTSDQATDDVVITADHVAGGECDASFFEVEDVAINAVQDAGPRRIEVSGFGGNLRIDAGAQNETFDVQLAPNAAITLIGGAGDDQFTFSAGFAQSVVVEGGAGNDQIKVLAAASADQFLLDETKIALNGAPITYSEVECVTIEAAAGADVFTINGLPQETAVTLDGGSGNDSFNLVAGTASHFHNNPLLIIGGTETDQISFDGHLQTAALALMVAEPRFAWWAGRLIADFDASMEAVNLTGGSAIDRFDVTPGVSTQFSVNGSSPQRQMPGDVLNLFLSGAAGMSLGIGTLNFSNRRPVAFKDIETFLNVGTRPFVTDCVLNNETAQALTFTFSDHMASSLFSYTLYAKSLSTGISYPGVPTASYQNGIQSMVTWKYSGVLPLPDGNYRVTLPAARVVSYGGQVMLADVTFDFYVMAGDANRDRKIDATDLGILSANWQGSGKTFSQGDFNYDGKVDISDLYILASKWQQTLPPPPPPAATVALGVRAPVRTASRIVNSVL